MKVGVIGTGYVGLVSGTCFAEIGHEVICLDIDETKVKKLSDGTPTIYEAGLKELLERNLRNQRLHFTSDYASLSSTKVVFLAVGTPSTPSGEADLSYLFSAIESSLPHLAADSLLVIKSTVPVGTAEKVRAFLAEHAQVPLHVVNNPEFLKEGTAVDDFMRPDRVVIGHESEEAYSVMEELYAPLVRQGNPILKMSNVSAEMTKYAANCFLATKISFINEIARLCDETQADIEEVRKGITSDKRIGPHFLYPGPGYGGSCFPKDVKALMATARQRDLRLKVIEAAEQVNQEQKIVLFQKFKNHFKGDIEGKAVAFWGVAFKPNTDDVRESSAIDLAMALLDENCLIHFFDPVAMENFTEILKTHPRRENIKSFSDKYECAKNCDALMVITDWSEFKSVDFDLLNKIMKDQVVIDGRNLFTTKKVQDAQMHYYALGKHIKPL